MRSAMPCGPQLDNLHNKRWPHVNTIRYRIAHHTQRSRPLATVTSPMAGPSNNLGIFGTHRIGHWPTHVFPYERFTQLSNSIPHVGAHDKKGDLPMAHALLEQLESLRALIARSETGRRLQEPRAKSIAAKVMVLPIISDDDAAALIDASNGALGTFADLVTEAVMARIEAGSAAAIKATAAKQQTLLHPGNYMTSADWATLSPTESYHTWVGVICNRLQTVGVFPPRKDA